MDCSELINAAFKIRAECDMRNNALKAYAKVVYPSQHAPFHEHDEFTGFMEALKYALPELHEEISFVFWD
jgi:hypothetical protein